MRKLLLAALVATVAILPVHSAFATKPTGHKVNVCHRTGSATNPYVLINVDIAAAGYPNGGGHDAHEQVGNGLGGDIIPAYEYTDKDGDVFVYPGKNLTTVIGGQTGAEILANGCKVEGEEEEEVKDMRVSVDPGDCDNPNAVITLDNTRTQNTGNNPITITIKKDGVEVFKEDIADGDFVVLTVADYSFLRTEVGESDTFVVTHGPNVLGEGTTNRLNCEPGDAVLNPAASIEANCDEATVTLDNSASVDGDEVDATVTFEVFINDGEASTVEVDAGESAVLPIVGLGDGDVITVSALDVELASATVSIDDGCVSVEDEPPTNPNPPGVNELPETL